MKSYSGEILPNIWEVYIKVDGTNFTCKDGVFRTRIGNKLDVPHISLPDGVYELFREDWGPTQSLKSRPEEIREDDFFLLSGSDSRLFLTYLQNPNESSIEELLKWVVSQGHEGLVLKQGRKELKVKPFVTLDVKVTGIKEGSGRNVGKVGSLITKWGNVLLQKDEDKVRFYDSGVIGSIIEVKAMGWTDDMKMRHARFLRLRDDKDTENLETIEEKYASN